MLGENVSGEQRKLRKGKLRNLYSLPDIIREIRHIEILIGKPEGKRQFWRLSRRWNDNIKADLRCDLNSVIIS